MLAPTPSATATWPITGDVPDLLVIVQDQVETIAAQAALIDAYQGVLAAAQVPSPPPPATGEGAAVTASTALSVTGTAGLIVQGATVTGTGLTPAPTVLGQISGTVGRDGTYLLSAPVTLTVQTALTFVPPPQPSSWPVPQDAATLNQIAQTGTAVIRVQTALLQHYQDLLNVSETPPPASGP